MSLIEYRNVEKKYSSQGSPAVNGVSLTVEKGEILALVGESGSGKTTLLRLAAGLEEPTAGEILFKGSCLAGNRNWVPPEKRRFGMMSQEGALFPHRNIESNIAYGLQGVSLSEKRQIVDEMLELVGMPSFAKRLPHELSGGERQRVALARTLAPKPEVVFLDEPFSNLDSTLRRELRDQICVILKSLGTTAILVVHDPDDALSAGDRIAIMKSGSLQQVATATKTYHQACCEYCACLFGPANVVDHEDNSVWLRPEQFKIKKKGTYKAKVDLVRETGRFCEVHVKPYNAAAKSWLLLEPAGSNFKSGDEVEIDWEFPNI
ncbi:MAG: ABC transporter ATP-binding protein [Verrucomicrobiota bacterium]